ncbi:MAG TPA: Gfo/Idh/MocA family oxidoreductase [Candidatus Kapabacteria bacterium]|jgi:predicted dehydrogenase|nr:Gfo/Idh/MocA family oxidoreductase [Candidatus Kapabacteria bacterium]
MSVRIGFIGCGAIANEHARALARLEGAELVAWSDVELASAERMRAAYGGRIATTDPMRVIGDDGVDVVYICTWHDSHAPLVEMAAEARRPVVLEKPIAISERDCVRIADAVERSGILLMMALKLRFYPMVERARSFIERPIISIAQVMDNHWPDDYWAARPVIGGGNVLSQGPHAMDLLVHLNRSEPVSIYADGGTYTHEGTLVDNVVATIRFANGAIASLAQGDSGTTPLVSKFSFQLADGTRTVHLHDRLRAGTFFDGTSVETLRDEEELGMLEENRAFLRALRGEIPPPTTHLDGLRATRMVLAAVEAIRTRSVQQL